MALEDFKLRCARPDGIHALTVHHAAHAGAARTGILISTQLASTSRASVRGVCTGGRTSFRAFKLLCLKICQVDFSRVATSVDAAWRPGMVRESRESCAERAQKFLQSLACTSGIHPTYLRSGPVVVELWLGWQISVARASLPHSFSFQTSEFWTLRFGGLSQCSALVKMLGKCCP